MKSYTSYFLGIPLPQKYLKEFGQVLDYIRTIDSSIETVYPQTPHITIYYLNKQAEYILEEMNEELKPFSSILNKAILTIGGFNYFTKDDPKVLFLDVKYPKALIDLRNKISEVLGKYSALDNNLPFHPHMTIGRIKNIEGKQSFNKAKNKIMERLEKTHWELNISEIALYGADSTKSPEYQEKLITIPIDHSMIELTDGFITLRPFVLENAIEHLTNEDEAQIKWLSGEKGTLEGVQNWIKRNQQYWDNDGPVFNFAIFDQKNNLIGLIEANTDYRNLDGVEEGDANISYGLYPFARRKGYMVRAISLMNDFLKNKKVKRSIIRIDPKNVDSLKVPQRSGFAENGIISINKNKKLAIFIKNLIK